jgi:hypothetical protein
MVHLFSQTHEWFEDYRRFVALFGTEGEVGAVCGCGAPGSIHLHAAWVVVEGPHVGRQPTNRTTTARPTNQSGT